MKRAMFHRLLWTILALSPVSPAVLASGYSEQAKALAGDDLYPLYQNFCKTDDWNPDLSQLDLPATKVFDNLVFLGRGKWNTWALLTQDGIILFDAMETADEAEKYIEGGLIGLGIYPASIKKIIVMHGHGDHFGGARYLQQKYDAEVLMSKADWALVEKTWQLTQSSTDSLPYVIENGRKYRKITPGQEPPVRQTTIHDGMTVTLGETRVSLYLTPGHTDGTVSAVIPLRWQQRHYVAGFWGGTGFSAKGTDLNVYLSSLQRFRQLADAKGVSVALSNHPVADTTLARWPQLTSSKNQQSHPFYLGYKGYLRVLDILGLCIRDYQHKTALENKE